MAGSCAAEFQTKDIGFMWKTVSEACNLACDYCYYSTCGGKPGAVNRIDSALLERFISQFMARSNGQASFAWQGGEPLLAGLDFFREVVSLQAKYAPPGTVISNSLQTNATLITPEWAQFFKRYHFLVGVSLDGPREIHDARRVYASGGGSFNRVMQGIAHLRREQVDFNILTVIHEGNVDKGKELMDFYREHGFGYVQFIPGMDFRAQQADKPPSFLVTPQQYGRFLCQVFDLWYNGGQPVISERFMDNTMSVHLGRQAEMCTHSATCSKTLILEQNGDAYPCDFYIHEDYKLGNVGTHSLEELLASPVYRSFATLKPELPESCKSCEYLSFCYGGCPRNRWWEKADPEGRGVPHPDYSCASYKAFYRHSFPRMEELALQLRRQWAREYAQAGLKLPGRNDLCFCGSGGKFKACCQPALAGA